VLKNKKEAVIRPLAEEDVHELQKFYAAIPDNERWYMRLDVMDPKTLREWVEAIPKGTVFSTVAADGDLIVAHARLHMQGFGSTKHIGRLRIQILPEYRRLRLGTWMLLDLIQLGMDKGLDDIRADFVVGVEDSAIEAARKLDFFKTAVLGEYIKGPDGARYDLQIMIKRLHRNWGDY
jgi:hypothetical protein